MSDNNEPKVGDTVEVMNGTAILTFTGKGTSKLAVKPGFLPLQSMN